MSPPAPRAASRLASMADIGFTTERSCADQLDAADPLGSFRSDFSIPRGADGQEQTYLVGHSLGARPIRARELVDIELDRWADLGVRGHFDSELAWEPYHQLLTEPMAALVGARPAEVVVMNSLTVNLHLLMISFYRPTASRHKILIEDHAFPSDHFAVESQIRQRGLDPASSLVTVRPRAGELTLRHGDLLAAIAEHGPELALVLLPGVQYYTGQVLDMASITRAAHDHGAAVGFDLAHAAGNIVLSLHDWDVDFAAWCTYKYLNSGPGGVGGCFVHERHLTDATLPKLLGWWGTNRATRFEMRTEFDAIPTVESWQISNAPILAMASLRASLEVFDRAGGMVPLRNKSELQMQYLDFLLEQILGRRIEDITPRSLEERGCQHALRVSVPDLDGRDAFRRIEAADVACDWRHPGVIRVAPVPLYNTFADIHRFVTVLDEVLT